MTLTTGGSASAAISTRSSPARRASFIASSRDTTPTWLPSAPIKRTRGARISSFSAARSKRLLPPPFLIGALQHPLYESPLPKLGFQSQGSRILMPGLEAHKGSEPVGFTCSSDPCGRAGNATGGRRARTRTGDLYHVKVAL